MHFAHHDDVTGIAFAPNGLEFTTGELGNKPTCYVIDAKTMTAKKELKGNGIDKGV